MGYIAQPSTKTGGSSSGSQPPPKPDPKSPASNKSTTSSGSSKSTNTTSLAQKVLRNYRDEILQINFLSGSRYNNTFYNADLFAVNQDVFGYEWKNGIYMRLPFPTFTRISKRFAGKGSGPKILLPLYNRFAPRPAQAKQMDCPIYLNFLGNAHYFQRFVKIRLQFTSPCTMNVYEKVILQKSGLRRFLKLRFKEHEYVIAFRSIKDIKRSRKNIGKRYTDYMFLAPTHHFVNFRSKLYLDDHRKDPNQGRQIKPDELLAQQVGIFQDMETYYQRSLDVLNAHNGDKNFTFSDQPIYDNNAVGEGTQTVTAEQSRRDQYDQQTQWGMGHREVSDIYNRLWQIAQSYRDVLTMCQKICTAAEYFYSWKFCSTNCGVEGYFMTNDESVSFNSGMFSNLTWEKINKPRKEPLPRKDRRKPFWTLSDVNDLWAGPRVVNCKQTWTSIICDM